MATIKMSNKEPPLRTYRQACETVEDDKETMMQTGFGVSVDMTRFFSDERSRVCVWARRGRRVRWLAARLRRRLRLPAPPALLAPAGLLHPDDPLALLQPHQTIRAIPAKEWFSDDGEGNSSEEDCKQVFTKKALIHTTCDEVDTSHYELSLVKQQALELLDQCAGLTKCSTDRSYLSPVSMGQQNHLDEILMDKQLPEDGSCAMENPVCTSPGSEPGPEPGPGPGPRRRRRVRRRPRRSDDAPLPDAPLMEVPELATVVRNVETRAGPRLVRALSSS